MKKNEYYKMVWEITEINAKNVNNNHLRGAHFHVDHVIPISFGFKYEIDVKIIGSLSNLKIISKEENFRKNSQITNEVLCKLHEFRIDINKLVVSKFYTNKTKRNKRNKKEIVDFNTQNKRSFFYYLKSNKLKTL